MSSAEMKQTQSYFSALARGGLTAAINYANVQAKYATSSSQMEDRLYEITSPLPSNGARSQVYESVPYNDYLRGSSNSKTLTNSNASSTQKQSQDNSYQLFQSSAPTTFQQHLDFKNQRKLQSLMSGNDLQPLEEEVSKEEDESVLLKADNNMHQHQHSYTFNNNGTNGGGLIEANPYDQPVPLQQSVSQGAYIQHMQMQQQQLQSYQQQRFELQQDLKPSNMLSMSRSSSQEVAAESVKYAQQQHQYSNGVILSTASLVSGDYNYDTGMEEAAIEIMRQQENSNMLKIFDPQFQQSYEKSDNGATVLGISQVQNSTLLQSETFKDQVALDQFNQQQKEKAKRIIESLKASQKLQSQVTNENRVPVERRLFDYHKRVEEKLESQRKQKQENEKKQLRPVPQISDKSNEILMRKSMMFQQQTYATAGNVISQAQSQSISPREGENYSPSRQYCLSQVQQLSHEKPMLMFANYQIEQKAYYEELQRKEDVRLKMLEEKEMQGFTGKPIINKKSKSLKRKVDDLLDWKEKQEKKREQDIQKKQMKEVQEIQELQAHKVVNKQSERIVETRTSRHEKVEDRLTRDAQLRQNKQKTSAQRNKIFTLDDDKTINPRKRCQSFKRPLPNHDHKTSSRSPRITTSKRNTKHSDLQYDPQRYFSQSLDCPLQMSDNEHSSQDKPPSYMKQKLKQSIQQQQQPYNLSHNQQVQSLSPPNSNEELQRIQNDFQYQQYLQQQQFYMQQQQQQQQQMMMMNQQWPNSFLYNQIPQFTPLGAPNQAAQTLQQQQMMMLQQQCPQSQLGLQGSFTQSLPDQTLDPTSQYGQNISYNVQKAQFNNTQPIQNSEPLNLQTPMQNINQTPQQSKPISKQPSKKPGQYISLFDKLQKMNVNQSQNSEDKESSRSSTMPVVSAIQPQLFSGFQSVTPQNPGANNLGYFNPIYQSIQIESQKLGSFAMGPTSQDFTQGRQMNQQQLNTFDYGRQHQTDLYQQACNSNHQMINNTQLALMSRNNPPSNMNQSTNQDVIIYKILENSFIPSGNVNQVRRVSDNHCVYGYPNFEDGIHHERIETCGNSLPTEDFTTIPRDPNDQGVILDSEMLSNSGNSDSNIVRNLNKVLNSQEPIQPTRSQSEHRNNAPSTDSNSPKTSLGQASMNQKNMGFMDRNNLWLQQKQSKIEKAKEIYVKKVERECPFKPQLVLQCQNRNSTSRSRSVKSRGRGDCGTAKTQVNSSQEEISNNGSKTTKEQANHSCTDSDTSKIKQYVAETTSIAQGYQNTNMGQTSVNITERMMTSPPMTSPGGYLDSFPIVTTDKRRQVQQVNIDDTDNCDISQLSPDMKHTSEAGNESSMDMGINELSHGKGVNKVGVVKVLNKKCMNF